VYKEEKMIDEGHITSSVFTICSLVRSTPPPPDIIMISLSHKFKQLSLFPLCPSETIHMFSFCLHNLLFVLLV
jgi:hypothetical protein